jgi:PAS domain S-box-containing protein
MPLSTLLRESPPARLTATSAMLLTGLIGVCVAVLDYVTPGDYDVGVFYAIAITISAWSDSRKFLWIATCTFVALIILGALLGAPPTLNWSVVGANRAFTVLSCILVAALVHVLMLNLNTIKTERMFSKRLLETLDLAQVIIRKVDGTIILWSYGAELLYGWSAEEAVGQISHVLLKTDFGDCPIETIEQTLKREWQWTGEVRHTRKNGTLLWIATQWTLDTSSLFSFPTVTEINNNITAFKLVENRPLKSPKVAPLVWQVSSTGRLVYVNERWREYFGQPDVEAETGNHMARFEHPVDAARSMGQWQIASKLGEMEPWESRYRNSDGVYHSFSCRALAVRDNAGNVVYWIGIATEIDK